MLLQYLGKFKSLIFCKYLADMENANKLYFLSIRPKAVTDLEGVERYRLVSIVL